MLAWWRRPNTDAPNQTDATEGSNNAEDHEPATDTNQVSGALRVLADEVQRFSGLQQENSDLKKQLLQFKEENQKLVENSEEREVEFQEIQRQLEESYVRNEVLDQENDVFWKKNVELVNEVKSLNSQVQSKIREVENVRSKILELEKENQHTLLQYYGSSREVQVKSEEIEEKKKEVDELTAQNKKLTYDKKSLLSNIEELKLKCSSMTASFEGKLKNLEAEKSEHLNRIQQLEGLIKKQSEETAIHRAKFNEETWKSLQLEKKISSGEDLLKEKFQEINTLKNDLKKKEEQLNLTSEEIKTKSEKNEQLTKRYNMLLEGCSILTTEKNNILCQLLDFKNLRSETNQSQVKTKELENEIKKLRKQSSAHIRSFQKERNKTEELRSMISSQKISLDEKELEINTLDNQVKQKEEYARFLEGKNLFLESKNKSEDVLLEENSKRYDVLLESHNILLKEKNILLSQLEDLKNMKAEKQKSSLKTDELQTESEKVTGETEASLNKIEKKKNASQKLRSKMVAQKQELEVLQQQIENYEKEKAEEASMINEIKKTAMILENNHRIKMAQQAEKEKRAKKILSETNEKIGQLDSYFKVTSNRLSSVESVLKGIMKHTLTQTAKEETEIYLSYIEKLCNEHKEDENSFHGLGKDLQALLEELITCFSFG